MQANNGVSAPVVISGSSSSHLANDDSYGWSMPGSSSIEVHMHKLVGNGTLAQGEISSSVTKARLPYFYPARGD